MGDGWFGTFTSVVDAVDSGMAIQRGLDGHPILRLRIGIHIGEVTHDDAPARPAGAGGKRSVAIGDFSTGGGEDAARIQEGIIEAVTARLATALRFALFQREADQAESKGEAGQGVEDLISRVSLHLSGIDRRRRMEARTVYDRLLADDPDNFMVRALAGSG